MSFVHDQSPGYMGNGLDLFILPATQTSEEHGRWQDIHPVSSITDRGPIEFVIDGSSEYLDLARSWIYVKAKVVAADGTAVTDKKVAPVNLFLHSLFSQVDVTLQGKLVSSGSNTYPYRAMFGTLLNYGNEAKTTRLTSELFYKDTAGAMDETDPSKAIDAGGNAGLASRYKHSNKSNSIELAGPIHADLFFQGRYILDMVELKLKFTRSDAAFCLMSGETSPTQKVVIEDATLFIRKIKPNPSLALALVEKLKTTPAKYPIRRTDVKVFSLASGSFGTPKDNVFNGQIPDRLVIAMVDSDAYNGSYTKSPYNFKHNNLRYLGVFANGNQVPQKPLQLKYSETGGQGFIMGYQSLFTGSGIMYGDHGNQISREDYADGYTLYCFNLTPDLSSGENFNLIKQGNLRIEIQFASALQHTVNLIVYAEFDSVLEIDHSRNVLFDYAA